MARPASQQIAGFYPTPEHLVPIIASYVAQADIRAGKTQYESPKGHVTFVDPCAGAGEAVKMVADLLTPDCGRAHNRHFYLCEMEKKRAEVAKNLIGYSYAGNVLHGDAFHATFEQSSDEKNTLGASLLWLNPPYDDDRVWVRLEEKFLVRFTDVLAEGGSRSDGGILVYIVPHKTLSASARTIATHYEDVACFRFPDADFQGFRQVVLFARRRRARLEADPGIVARCEAWARGDNLEELSEQKRPRYRMPVVDRRGLSEWWIRPCDVEALMRKHAPWHVTSRGGKVLPLPGVLPDVPVADLMLRKYPLATPPRPAHIAAGIASGVFNGSRIEPDDGAELPPLLVKGVFDREFVTVEEKTDKDGRCKGLVQVQQPKLVVTVLDLDKRVYVTLGAGTEASRATDLARWTVADLLEHYSKSLMGVMREQCPVLYDPERDAGSIDLVPSLRKLFTAQEHAAKAVVKVLSDSREGAGEPWLLGEIGSGKTTVALVAARTAGARKVLCLCPPHLLKNWCDEVRKVFPDARVRVIASIEDVEEAERDDGAFVVCILSREAAKLGHGWESLRGSCPRCGAHLASGIDYAKKRATCEHREILPSNAVAQACMDLARVLCDFTDSAVVRQLCKGRIDRKRMKRSAERIARLEDGQTLWTMSARARVQPILERMLSLFEGKNESLVERCVFAMGAEDQTIIDVAKRELARSQYAEFPRAAVYWMEPGTEAQAAFATEYKIRERATVYGYGQDSFDKRIEKLKEGLEISEWGRDRVQFRDGRLLLDGIEAGSLDAALKLLDDAIAHARWVEGPECGERLYAAVSEPRRVSIARHIVRYHRGAFDFLVLDESHEYASDGSAQERAGHRLTTLRVPTLLMTGSAMNGYAESMFTNSWATSPNFRTEFERTERAKFVTRFGYSKRILEDRDGAGKVVEFGAHTDRVQRTERKVGDAPGILPLFLLRHLLPQAVTLHKADLAIDLPRCTQERHLVPPTKEQKARYEELLRKLVTQIRQDMGDEVKVGKLFGQLAELPSYLDRCTADVGNVEDGSYEIRYPESLDGQIDDMLVAREEGFPAGEVLPKEEWMLERLRSELSEGRNVMVLSWHVGLLPRLARLVAGEVGAGGVIVLHADKVAPGKRQDWIDREIVQKKRRVLVANPVAIQTGLNNLVWFATQVWMENPACNPITYRQSVGRLDRIGQTKETRIHFPLYAGTLQEQLHELLLKKVAVSVSTDGLDPESALAAAGVADDGYLMGLSVGKQLWSMIGGAMTGRAMVNGLNGKVRRK
jgi:hypothetical protein